MRIQHNIAALNSHRNLTNNNSAVAKNLEKLSSGYRINRAGDDAAGLAISEKMRAQITGLETAQKNAQDGISLVQTAEGALTEVHSMLNRMVELATQSANGTYDDDIDRDNLQKEMNALVDEIDRISQATNFNGINLLDGTMGGPKISSVAGKAATTSAGTAPTASGMPTAALIDGTTSPDTAAKIELDFAGGTAALVGSADADGTATITFGDFSTTINVAKGVTVTAADIAAKFDGQTININGKAFAAANASGKVTLTAADDGPTGLTAADMKLDVQFTAGQKDNGDATNTVTTMDFDGRIGADLIGGSMKVGDTTYSFVKAGDTVPENTTAITLTEDADADAIAQAVKDAVTGVANAEGNAFTAGIDGSKVTFTADDTGVIAAPKFEFKGIGLNLQIGDTPKDFNKLTVSVGSMSAEALGIDAKQINISTQTGAKAAIDKIKAAINTVSSTRGDLGAVQNRLEHTINNLSVTTENMTAAESRIRDVDMAKEMMAYTKNNILVQASQAMLAQANQLPQGVLQLLQ